MAHISEEVAVIRVSQLTRNADSKPDNKLTPDLLASVEEVIKELVGVGCVVEVESADE